MTKLLKIVILSVLCTSSIYAQKDLTKYINRKELINYWKADSLFNIGQYTKAIEYYKSCVPKNNFDIAWPVKKSLCYLLVKDTVGAQKYFEKYVSKGGHYLYTSHINQIPFYNIIAKDKKVQSRFWKNTSSFENSDSTCLYPEVLKILIDMRTLDQAYRNGEGNPNIPIRTIDSLNRVRLDSLLNI